MATEVKHGPNPTFEADIRGEDSLTLVSHYTATPNLAAGGVTAVKYESDQDGKGLAELLAMRTIFLEWWISEWVARGGDHQEGVGQACRLTAIFTSPPPAPARTSLDRPPAASG